MKRNLDNNMTSKSHANLSTSKRSIDACFSSQSVEWNTPTHIVQSVLRILKTIDVDPCCNSRSTPNIPAKRLYTKAENGLKQTWNGRVYMNPPYGRGIQEWVEKLHNEYKAKNIIEAIALVPSRTDTKWFKILRQYPRCFIEGRLKFSHAKNSAPFPSVVVYLGANLAGFVEEFSTLGDIFTLYGNNT